MSIKYTVQQIPTAEAKPWILKKHYAKRMPMVEVAFGLFDTARCIGACTFGDGSGNINNNSLGRFKVNELNRLVIDDGVESNAASYFVSRCLKLMPSPRVIISYADTDVGHIGYVYQATNWIYTGVSEGRRVYIRDGREYHRKSVYDILGKHTIEDAARAGFVYHKGMGKHRYFFMLGNKSEKREMMSSLQYEQCAYPKGNTNRHIAAEVIHTQAVMF